MLNINESKDGFSSASTIGLSAAFLSASAALFAGFGTRFGLWGFRVGLEILRWAAYVALAASFISFLGCVLDLVRRSRNGFLIGLAGLIMAVIIVVVPYSWMRAAKHLPPIHDITTDTTNPPKFTALLALRKDALNSDDYGGPAIAVQQMKAYPDIVPLFMNVQPEDAFDRAFILARKLGWKIIDADRNDLRIEAVDTTFWFGFKDDIVIRIAKTDSGSRVDIRSASRVGISDIGTNAKRIRRFLSKMK